MNNGDPIVRLRLESSVSEVYEGTPVAYVLRVVPAPEDDIQVTLSADSGAGNPVVTTVDVPSGQGKTDVAIQGLVPGSYVVTASLPDIPSSESASTKVRVRPRKGGSGTTSAATSGATSGTPSQRTTAVSAKGTSAQGQGTSVGVGGIVSDTSPSTGVSTSQRPTDVGCVWNDIQLSAADCSLQQAQTTASVDGCDTLPTGSVKDACLWQLVMQKVSVSCDTFTTLSLRQSCQTLQGVDLKVPQDSTGQPE